ncbi:MAG: Archaeal ATPase [Methanomethylovorans sp. PtaU1.Bin073]|nr:MAG: Archaeal ATPase [Methanomethylovorans sp. PtaU1.Bin073]
MERAFIYGKPVIGPYFTNREKEISLLLSQIESLKQGGSINIALLGQRRVGKTSLIKNTMLRFDNDVQVIPIFIDCMSMPSIRRLSMYIAESAKNNYSEKKKDTEYISGINHYLKKNLSDIFSRIPNIDVSITSYISLKLSLQEQKDEQSIFEKSLNYLEQLAIQKDVYFVVFADEFSEIAMRWGDEFVRLLRTIIQQQTRVMYIFSSSAVTYMTDLVYNNKSPFYRQLKPVSIGPLPKKETKKFIIQRLHVVNHTISDNALEKMIKITNGLPDYVQRLGDIVLETSPNEEITEGDIENAYEEMFITLDAVFNLLFTKLTENSKVYSDIVVSIAQYEKAGQIANDIGVPVSSLYYYLPYLINLGIIEKVEKGKYKLVDPLFKQWIINKFRLQDT